MLTYDGFELRALVQKYYDELSPGISDAAELNKIYDEVADATLRTLRDALHDWNCSTQWHTLPNELLASCFVYLPFGDRVVASHVSQHWRAVALASPAVWSHIDTSFFFFGRNIEFLSTVLTRTGQHPLDVEIRSDYAPFINPVLSALEPYFHRFRSLEWSSQVEVDILRSPAPLFHSFRCFRSFVIHDDFLGGQVGSLRKLYFWSSVRLPSVCPALLTVVEFEAMSLDSAENAASFKSLFQLCPRLEWLHLRKLLLSCCHLLPAGPAPRTLRKLHLDTGDRGYDLTQHYLQWRGSDSNSDTPGMLRDVFLDMMSWPALDLHALFDGAQTLLLDCHGDDYLGRAIISMTSDGGRRRHGVTLPINGTRPPEPLARLFGEGCLRAVGGVTLSADALARFVPDIARLPRLREITVHFSAEYEVGAPHLPLCFDALDRLTRLPEPVSLTVEVFCRNPLHCLPTVDDARALLVKLAAICESLNLAAVNVRGFAEDVVGTLECDDALVWFDTQTVVRELEF